MVEQRQEYGRIVFPGNPWPRGHAVRVFEWSGRLAETGDVWFDLHLRSAEYAAEGAPEVDEEDDWRAPGVWDNYHRCTLSSVYWREEGLHSGVRVGDARAPFEFAHLDGQTIVADAASAGEHHSHERHHSFRIYLLGHDGVADHRISFTAARDARLFDVQWVGRIALVYAGDDELRYSFGASVRDVGFEGFEIAEKLDARQAERMFRAAVVDHERFVLVERDGRRVMALR